MVLRPSVRPPSQLKSPRQWAVKPLARALNHAQESSVPLVVKPVPMILKSFSTLTDPRLDRRKRHLLIDIVVIALCAVVCGANNWVSIQSFGRAKYDWFQEFLSLPNGIPSHDTFGRVFSLLSPTNSKPVSCGGSASSGSKPRAKSWPLMGKLCGVRRIKKTADQRFTWSARGHRQHVNLGQPKTDAKSNEITAIPALLQVLDL